MRNEEKTGKQRTGNWEWEMSFTSSFSILCFLFPAHQFIPLFTSLTWSRGLSRLKFSLSQLFFEVSGKPQQHQKPQQGQESAQRSPLMAIRVGINGFGR